MRNDGPLPVEQMARVAACAEQGAVIAYWCSDAHGRPANGGSGVTAYPGAIHEAPGPLRPCWPGTLHATREPHRWAGSRVWVVALWGEVEERDDKLACLRREIIGEVLPEHAPDPSVGVRLGRKDLRGANLYGADLTGADLTGANLTRANLTGADLYGANLYGANLTGADLTGANLTRADLRRADFTGANLYGANLYGANLTRADLRRADFTGANLTGADLTGANLRRANLYGADLTGANLRRANFTGARRAASDPPIPGWRADTIHGTSIVRLTRIA